MQNNIMAATNVRCELASCKHHRSNDCCALSAIKIAPCAHCGTGKPQDETMCADYCANCQG